MKGMRVFGDLGKISEIWGFHSDGNVRIDARKEMKSMDGSGLGQLREDFRNGIWRFLGSRAENQMRSEGK